MKIFSTLILILLTQLVFCQDLLEFDLKPYNDEYQFEVITDKEIAGKNPSLEALIIIFENQNYENAQLSITNNPQLKEVKIFHANQQFLVFVSKAELKGLTHLFFERFDGQELTIPPLPTIEHLDIQSSKLVKLDMTNATLNKLGILDIDADQLKTWTSAKSFPQLGLIELKAPLLEQFPIENMPEISQFSFECSFHQFPLNLCSYKELQFISFNNYFPLQVDECLRKKVWNGVYSNVTIYDKRDGKVITEVLSKDRKE